MNDSDFMAWADQKGLEPIVLEALQMAAARADEDSLVGRYMLDLAGIMEYTDDVIVDACPFDEGFVVFGDCPNGDLVAIDVSKEKGSIVYLSHEGEEERHFPSIKVATSVLDYLEQLADDKMPTDYHEALAWSRRRDG